MSTERRIVALGAGAILGLTALVVVVLNWQLIVTAVLTLLLVGFLVLIAVCLLFRIATGGRIGSVILGSLVTAILMRRRR